MVGGLLLSIPAAGLSRARVVALTWQTRSPSFTPDRAPL